MLTLCCLLLLQLQVSEGYKDLFLQIQEHIASENPPLCLFNNIVQNETKGSHMFQTCAATFIDPLNNDYAIHILVPSIDSKTEVCCKIYSFSWHQQQQQKTLYFVAK